MKPLAERRSEAEEGPALPTAEDVRDAVERLAGHAVLTPLIRSDALDSRLGARLLLKAEPLQRTGSFKFRGAYNRISRLSRGDAGGIVAYSSGNHAQAAAAAAAMLGMPAVIVMPNDAPAIKIAGTRRHGAEVVMYDRLTEQREAIGEKIAAERGATVVKPYDDFHVIAGQGTVGHEIVYQCEALGCRPDAVVAPTGGGGLMAGMALAISDAWPGTRLYTCEPEGFDDHARSFAEGRRVAVADPGHRTLCDALRAQMPGALTFPINATRVAGSAVVSDGEVATAMRAAFEHLKLVVEPGGAAALAAILAGKVTVAGQTVVAVLSGGNVDHATFQAALDRAGETGA